MLAAEKNLYPQQTDDDARAESVNVCRGGQSLTSDDLGRGERDGANTSFDDLARE